MSTSSKVSSNREQHITGSCDGHSSGGGSSGSLQEPLTPPVLVVRLSGSGWLLAFQCGVGKFIQDHMDVDSPRLRFGGQSGGSLIASALAAGMDVDCVFEESLGFYEPCKHNAFRMRKCLKQALNRLAPPDDAWVDSRHKLIVGMSRIQHLGKGRMGWRSNNVTEFRSREHGLRVLEASCHLPVISGVLGVEVDGHRYFDGGLAELVPDITPEQIGLNSDPSKGPVDPVLSVDVCAWGNKGEGYHICPGFAVPLGWFFFPHNPGVLHKLFRLGYCRAAECFAKADPWVTQGLWRPGMRLSYAHLPGIAAQLDELVEFLLGADPFCCINAMLTFRQKYSKPNPERMAGLHIKQLPLPDTEDVLQQVAQAQADCVLGLPGLGVGCGLKLRAGSCADGLCLPDTPKGVTDYLRRQGTQQQHYQPPSRLGGQQAQGCGREARGRSASCSYGGELLPPSAAGQAAEGCVAQEACCGAAEAAARTCLAPGTQPACGQEPSTCRMGRPEGHGKDKQEQHLQQEQDHSGMPGDAGATWGLGGDEMQPPATPPTHPLAPQPPPLQGVGSSRSDNNSGSSVALPRAVVDGLAVVAGCAGLGVAGREQQQQQEQRRSYLSQLEDEHNGGSDAGGGPEGAGEGSGAPTAEARAPAAAAVVVEEAPRGRYGLTPLPPLQPTSWLKSRNSSAADLPKLSASSFSSSVGYGSNKVVPLPATPPRHSSLRPRAE